MSNWKSQHLEDGVALRYLDGELPARKARHVRKHLEACWQCRAEIEAIEATVADCMKYRKQVLAAQLPEPPAAWADITRGFDRIDAELSAEPFWKRLAHLPPSLMWSAATVGVAVLVCAVFYQLRETPSVQAAVLLKKAVAAEQARPAGPRRVRIRTSKPAVAPAALFAAAHYDAADPLSARSFSSWRDQLPEKRDEVSSSASCQAEVGQAVSPVQSCYRLRTSTGSGDVASASLTLRSTDLLPIQGKLEFRDQNWIEFTDLSEVPSLHDGSPVASLGELPVRPAVPSRPAAIPPGETASISDELQVLSALHGIGADLGDPVEVKLSGGHVEVTGVGVSTERQRQIHGALDSLPHVEVAFSDPGAVPAPVQATAPEPAPVPSGSATSNTQLQTRLEHQLGGHAELERFTSRVLDWDEAAMARAYALRALSLRFPADQESAMTPGDRRVLRQLAQEHIAALQAHISGMTAALTPVLTALGASAPAAPQPEALTSWQPGAEQIFRGSRRLEMMLSLLLGVTSGEKPSADLPANLLSALAELRIDLEQCQARIGRL